MVSKEYKAYLEVIQELYRTTEGEIFEAEAENVLHKAYSQGLINADEIEKLERQYYSLKGSR